MPIFDSQMRAFLFTGLLLVSQVSSAQLSTGNDLNNWSAADDRTQFPNARSTDYMESSMLNGYIRGVVDAPGSLLCVPNGVTMGQMLAIVKKYVREHPEKWMWNGSWMVTMALSEAFPCPKK